MIKAIDLTRGAFVLYNGQPYLVVERDLYSPGKGSALAHVKLKNIKSGAVLKVVFKTTDELEEAAVEQREVKYLYSYRDSFCFVEGPENKRIMLSGAIVGDDKDFLKIGETYHIIFHENEPVVLKLPIKLELIVTEAEDSVRGDTANATTKEVVLETGMRLKTPGFIKKGDKISVNTEKREYTGRV